MVTLEVLPSPSSPSALSPQQNGSPPLVTAQVWNCPAEIAATPLIGAVPAGFNTCTGILDCDNVPLPGWFVPSVPQQKADPPLVKAHVCSKPAEIATTPLIGALPVGSKTAAGVAELVA
jgi:hypothetical protein